MTKKAVLALFAIVLVFITLTNVFALDFSAELTPESRTVKGNDIVAFNLTLIPYTSTLASFDIISPDIKWAVKADANRIPPTGRTVQVLLTSYISVPGFYGVPIIVRPKNDTGIWRRIVFVHMLGENDNLLDYLPAVRTSINLGVSNDTKEPVNFTIDLENQNIKTLPRIDIKLRSNLFSKDIHTNLSRLEKRQLFSDMSIEPNTLPQNDSLSITIIAWDKDKPYTFQIQPKDFEISSFKKFKTSIEQEQYYLITKKRIIVENTGNLPGLFEHKERIFLFMRWLATPSKSAVYKDGYYVWQKYLDAGGKFEVQIAYNYWPPFLIVLITLLSVLSYYTFRSPLILTKKIKVVNASKNLVWEIVVMLKFTNRANKKLRNIRVYDILPHNAYVSKTTPLQTIAPLGPIKQETGKRIHWRIEDIPARAGYLLAYQIRYEVPITKRILLSRAHTKFNISRFRTRRTRSNKIKVDV